MISWNVKNVVLKIKLNQKDAKTVERKLKEMGLEHSYGDCEQTQGRVSLKSLKLYF